MKKITSLLLSVFMLFGFVMPGFAADETEKTNAAGTENEIILQIGNPTMTVNGEDMPIDEQGTVPVIVNNRTLLPVRAIVEKMGGTVGWNGETQEVTLNYGEDEIRLVIDNTTAYLNGEPQTLDVAPTVINDRTMLPIRFIAESFKFNVDWDDAEQRVTISKTTEVTEPSSEPTSKPEKTTSPEQPDESADSDNNEALESKALIVYFSATGTTKALAETIAETTGADIFEIVPETPYTNADLSYNNDNCRANQEQNDASARPAIANKIENIDDYDTIFLGYPIWWGTMPKIINTFLESYDLSGKTIMPFCTSGGSGISGSMTKLKELCADSNVTAGLDSSSAASIDKWLNDTGFNKTEKPKKALVAYFSATGNTEGIANYIADITSADKYEIEAAVPYTADDLKYYTGCRADREQNDPNARPEISGKIDNIDDYDTIFLGYPIWHGQAPKIIYTFLESYDFGGKTIIPFCTSASSGIGSSATNLHKLAEAASWKSGTRFPSSASKSSVASWINGLGLDIETN